MHSNDVSHAPEAWRGFAPHKADRTSGWPDHGHRHHGGDHGERHAQPPRDAKDLVRTVKYERVVTALRMQYGVGRSVPVQGASAADAATQDLANAVNQA